MRMPLSSTVSSNYRFTGAEENWREFKVHSVMAVNGSLEGSGESSEYFGYDGRACSSSWVGN